jgi:peptide deformylase
MTVREILKMGDPRLLRIAKPVEQFDTPEMRELVADMFETMKHANGAGLAAPQIGVDLQLVIYGYDSNVRYPEAPPVPRTVLINPVITPLDDGEVDGWEGCLSVPGLRGVVPRWERIRYTGVDEHGNAIAREADGMRDFTQFGFTSVLFPDMDPNADD